MHLVLCRNSDKSIILRFVARLFGESGVCRLHGWFPYLLRGWSVTGIFYSEIVFDDKSLAHLAAHEDLEAVAINDCDIVLDNARGLEQFRSLLEMSLADSHIHHDSFVIEFLEQVTIDILTLSGTNLSQELIEMLRDRFPKTRIIFDYSARNSPFVPAAGFNQVAYSENPQEYLSVSEPGRVWQSAPPGPGIPVLASVSSTHQTLKQGEEVRLSVKTVANQPVTFTSFNPGTFDNKLNSISVAANELGVAEATFTPPPRTIFDVNIVAASPAASGKVSFVVEVKQRS